MGIVVSLVLFLILFCVLVTNLQLSHPAYLPTVLHNWNFLPLWMHSFEPWDEAIMAAVGCCCRKKGWADDELKEVILNKTPKDSSAKLVTRQRSSNSFSLMMETNYTYNKLPPAHKIFSPPSPLIEKLLPVSGPNQELRSASQDIQQE